MDLLLLESKRSASRCGGLPTPVAVATPHEPVQLTKHGGSYSMESEDGAYVYFAKSFTAGPIWRVPSSGGQEELVIDEPVHWSNFSVVGDGIYYIAVPATGRAASSHLYGAAGNALRFSVLRRKDADHSSAAATGVHGTVGVT